MKNLFITFVSLFVANAVYAVSIDATSPKIIQAEKIEYDLKTETIKTTGITEITNKSGQKMTLSDSYITNGGQDLSGSDIQIWLGPHVYMASDNIKRDGDITIACDGTFTACKNCDNYGEAWEITAKKIKHDTDSRLLSFYNMVFWIYDFPVFWLPYFDMPDPGVKHKSGFLTPNLASTNNMGTQINVPFYVYLSDMHDATLTLSYLTKENPLFQLEHRLNTKHAEFRTRGSFTHNREGENRWHVFNDDVIELGENARATIFLERASDKTYLQKYGFYDEQPFLDSGARIELFGQSGYVVADAHIFLKRGDAQVGAALDAVGIRQHQRAQRVEGGFLHLQVVDGHAAGGAVVDADEFAVARAVHVGLDAEIGAVARRDERRAGILLLDPGHAPVRDHQRVLFVDFDCLFLLLCRRWIGTTG